MRPQYSGAVFIAAYIALIGVASFLQKFAMKELNPYQVNFLMAMGMLVTAVPALWTTQGTLAVPLKALPMGGPIGLMMALGSISYVLALSKLPAGTTAAVASTYVIVVLLLSWLFLNEPLTWSKILGIALATGGVALLALEEGQQTV